MKKGGAYRNTVAVSRKWNAIRKKRSKFNGIYNRIDNNRPRGFNEMNVLLAAKEYTRMEGHEFTLERV